MSTLRIETRGEIAILRMDKARANAIDPPFVADLVAAARQLSGDSSVRGVLLASAHPKIFCPGLDLMTLLELDRAAMESFMMVFAEAVQTLYAFPKPLLAAVNGHAVAGGCVLMLTADYRVLKTEGAQVGLNEVKVGVPLPWSVAELLRASVPPPYATKVGLLGRNFASAEALAAGLVDELAPADGFEDACLARLNEFVEKDLASFARTKAYFRAATLASMGEGERGRIGEWLDCWFSESTRNRIGKTVEALKSKR